MSGFKSDVISILKQNHMFEREAVGWVLEHNISKEDSPLIQKLFEEQIPVTTKDEKVVVNYDFIVLDKYHYGAGWLITALTRTGENGIIILEIDRSQYSKHIQSRSLFGGFNVFPVRFEDRLYFVLRKGSDYGD